MPMSVEFRKRRLAALSGIAKRRGGTLLARNYTVLRAPLTARCANGHRFAITPKNLLRGLWCVQCRPLPRQAEFLTAAQKLARSRGGRCLSEGYSNARAKLRWQCGERHRWQATFDNVVNKNSWCPTCAVAGASERKRKWWRQQRTKRATVRPRRR